ncbi:hypothetical protein WDU94_011575, partial [Cyamophila willieti]
VTELEAEFEKVKGARATPQRYLRSQQAKQAEEEAVEDRDDADGDPTVRESSMVAIGTAMKVVGEKAIMPFLEDVNDANKMTKIKEYCDKAVLCVKQPKPQKERPTTAPSKQLAAKGGSNAPKVIKTGGAAKAIKGGGGGGVNSATMTRKPAASGGGAKAKPTSGGSGTSKSSSSTKLGPNGGRVASEKDLSDEEVEERAGEMLPSNMVADLTDANWKTRLAAMEQLKPVSFSETLSRFLA